jgi:hypothetical protein
MSKVLLETGDVLLLETSGALLLEVLDVDTANWRPSYPDRLPPARRLLTAAQQAFAINVSPIINPAPPTELTWHPHYPDRVDRRVWLRVANQPTRTSFIGNPVADLRWLATYPARIFRPRLPVALYPATPVYPISALLEVGKLGGWRPIYPSWLDRKLPTRTGTSIWLVDPTTLLNAAHCLEWTSETSTLPAFSDEVRLSPDLASETATLPAMAEENLC